MRKILLSILIVISVNLIFAQGVKKVEPTLAEKSLINWITLEEALEKQKTQPKKIFVDVYTDWCGWCKHMMKTTFSNKQIASYINQYYYPVRFNGETTDTIVYLGDTLVNKGSGKRSAHQLTKIITNNRPSYPTITYLDEKARVISPVPGYMDIKKIEPYLVFFTENVFRTTKFEVFHSDFDKTFIDSLKIIPEKINWKTFEEAEKATKKQKKIILVNVKSPWSVSSKVMDTTTYGDAELSKYINEKFYSVKLDIITNDSITFFGKDYINYPNNPYNEIALYLLNKQMIAPSTVFISPEGVILSHVPGYFAKSDLEPVLHFFEEGAYKTQKWEMYVKEYKLKKEKNKVLKTN